MDHGRRFYRHMSPGSGTAFNVKLHTSDLHIIADYDLHEKAYAKLVEIRDLLDEHIRAHQDFLISLSPVPRPAVSPEIAAMMYRASELTGTGPMAAVAGAVAELVGRELLKYSGTVIVENGGDIWLSIDKPLVMALYVNSIYFRDNLAIRIYPDQSPCSVCTSSPRLGHSLSFGKADSVTMIAADGAVADAAATMVCNAVQSENDMESALERGLSVQGVTGGLIVFRDRIAMQGNIELAPPAEYF